MTYIGATYIVTAHFRYQNTKYFLKSRDRYPFSSFSFVTIIIASFYYAQIFTSSKESSWRPRKSDSVQLLFMIQISMYVHVYVCIYVLVPIISQVREGGGLCMYILICIVLYGIVQYICIYDMI